MRQMKDLLSKLLVGVGQMAGYYNPLKSGIFTKNSILVKIFESSETNHAIWKMHDKEDLTVNYCHGRDYREHGQFFLKILPSNFM